MYAKFFVDVPYGRVPPSLRRGPCRPRACRRGSWLGSWRVSIRRPFVVYSHGEELTTWRQAVKMRVMVWTYRRADLIIANSEFTRDELVKLGVAIDKIALLYPGVDIDRFRPGLPTDECRRRIGIARDQKLIVSVGRLSRRKGFDQVIRALPLLNQRGLDVHYAAIGIGEDHEYLRSLAMEMGVAGQVHFLGHVASGGASELVQRSRCGHDAEPRDQW